MSYFNKHFYGINFKANSVSVIVTFQYTIPRKGFARSKLAGKDTSRNFSVNTLHSNASLRNLSLSPRPSVFKAQKVFCAEKLLFSCYLCKHTSFRTSLFPLSLVVVITGSLKLEVSLFSSKVKTELEQVIQCQCKFFISSIYKNYKKH